MRTLTLVLVMLLALSAAFDSKTGEAAPQNGGRCAIAAEGPDEAAEITHLTGRAPFYQVYDMEGNFIEVIENRFLSQEFNIGPQAAALLGEREVTLLVGGMAGPKMKDVLDQNDIRFVYRKGVVSDVVNELKGE